MNLEAVNSSSDTDHELAMRVFLAVAEENGFSAGARRIGIPQSTASRQIVKLEKRLGAKLFQRSTRRLNLTASGEAFLERVRLIISEIDNATALVSASNTKVAGLLRVAMPSAFGRYCVLPLLKEFQRQHPEVQFGLSLSDDVQDLIQLGFDVSIRMGALPDSDLIAKKLLTSRSILCASPAYLDLHGRPTSAEDLASHNCLQFRSSPGQNNWQLEQNSKTHRVRVSGGLYCDSGDTLMTAALQGMGIAYLPQWLLQQYVDSGDLEVVLPDYQDPRPNPIHAVYPTRKLVPRKVTVFVEFMANALRKTSLP